MSGPGDPEFDAKMRERWIERMRELVREKKPEITDEQFDKLIADFDATRDEFLRDIDTHKKEAHASARQDRLPPDR